MMAGAATSQRTAAVPAKAPGAARLFGVFPWRELTLERLLKSPFGGILSTVNFPFFPRSPEEILFLSFAARGTHTHDAHQQLPVF